MLLDCHFTCFFGKTSTLSSKMTTLFRLQSNVFKTQAQVGPSIAIDSPFEVLHFVP